MTGFERIARLWNDAADLIVVSALIVLVAVIWFPGIQNRAQYGLAGLVLGAALGLAARWAGLFGGAEIIATIVGVVAGPVTVAKMHNKTIFEVMEEIRKSRKGGDNAD